MANKLKLSSGSSPRGAQMGRPNKLPVDTSKPIQLRLVRLYLEDTIGLGLIGVSPVICIARLLLTTKPKFPP